MIVALSLLLNLNSFHFVENVKNFIHSKNNQTNQIYFNHIWLSSPTCVEYKYLKISIIS